MAYRPAILSLRPRRADLQAGLTVAIVALPLSMAIAIASGVGPDRGLISAIVGGALVSAMGGTRHQIGGPAGAFIVLVAGCVAAIGVPGLLTATLLAGAMLVLLGLFRLGGTIRFVPYPVILGFSAGIGVVILASQLRDLLGLTLAGPEPGALLHKLPALWAARGTASPAALAVAALTAAVILGLQRWAPRAPSLLVGVAVATLAGLVLPVETVADRFGALPAGLPVPSLPPLDPASLMAALPWAASFALLGSIESLLSAMVADQMAGTRMRPDDELIGQGVANAGAALFGGMIVTGTIARTATNVRAGSTGPASGLIHAAALLTFLLVAAPLAGAIPLAGLAGLLAIVAVRMVEAHAILSLLRISRGDAAVAGLTFAVTIGRDLTAGIVTGMAAAGLAFVARMARTAGARPGAGWEDRDPQVQVIHLDGPVFFGAVARIEGVLDRIGAHPRLLMLDMAAVPLVDSTGAQMIAALAGRLDARGTRTVVVGASPAVRAVLGAGLSHAATPAEARALVGP